MQIHADSDLAQRIEMEEEIPVTTTLSPSKKVSWNPNLSAKHIFAEVMSAAIGGIMHSFVETPIVIPIEASITQTQINGKNFISNFTQLARAGQLYRSLPTALIGAAPKAISHYAWLVLFTNVWIPSGNMKEATTGQSIVVGLSTGCSEVFISTPLNFCKFRMQRPEWGYTGLMDAIRTVSRTEGLSAFWKGTLPTFCRNSTCMAGMLGSYSYISPLFPETFHRRHLVAGMCGGMVGSLISYPFEMWRAARMHNRNFYEDMLLKGPKRMLAGWMPGAMRLVITSGIMGELLPRLKGWSRGSEGAMDVMQSIELKEDFDPNVVTRCVCCGSVGVGYSECHHCIYA